MKHIFRLSLLFTLFLINFVSCMELDNHLGAIDKLMLLRKIKDDGEENIKEKIANIQKYNGARVMPLIITYVIISGDDSELSKNIFASMKRDKIISKNPRNRLWNRPCTSFIPIDECTSVFEKEGKVTAITTFFNAQILLDFLKKVEMNYV